MKNVETVQGRVTKAVRETTDKKTLEKVE